MAVGSDIVVIGGGVAGLSAAAALAAHAKVVVLEAETHTGFHSSGRSATMLHYALGDRLVRALTLASRNFFDAPPEGFSDVPLGRRMPVLVYGREDERSAVDALAAEIAPFAALDRLDERGIADLCPLLKVGEGTARQAIVDRNGIRLDPHALMQSYTRQLRRRGGELRTGARVRSASRRHGRWEVTTESGDIFRAPILINAAGAWADRVAELAGVAPIGLAPLSRTIITFDAPAGLALAGMPFAKTIADKLYFAPESGRIFASPMDEVPSEPCDAQPDEYHVALAAQRVEEHTQMVVARIHSRWAGLRTFAPDRRPVVGFAPGTEGFLWLAGQGGAGLQTSPAIAGIVESVITGAKWPAPSVAASELSPARFVR